jgi:hypothetical protein
MYRTTVLIKINTMHPARPEALALPQISDDEARQSTRLVQDKAIKALISVIRLSKLTEHGTPPHMDFPTFHSLVTTHPRPVILVEGTRDLPDADRPQLVSFAKRLAEFYPHTIFRTGNATGSDEAFAEGVRAIDPSRLQYVLPYAGHRKQGRDASSYTIALTELPIAAEERAAYVTKTSSPEYVRIMDKRNSVPQLKSKARYLIRDTLKVTGDDDSELAPANVGIFYVNAADPMKGGTGHTIRVCNKQDIPIATQDEWMRWAVK